MSHHFEPVQLNHKDPKVVCAICGNSQEMHEWSPPDWKYTMAKDAIEKWTPAPEKYTLDRPKPDRTRRVFRVALVCFLLTAVAFVIFIAGL